MAKTLPKPVLTKWAYYGCEFTGGPEGHDWECGRQSAWDFHGAMICHKHYRFYREQVGWEAHEFRRVIWNGDRPHG